MVNGVATAVVSEVKDPANLGRVQIHLSPRAGGGHAMAYLFLVRRLSFDFEERNANGALAK